MGNPFVDALVQYIYSHCSSLVTQDFLALRFLRALAAKEFLLKHIFTLFIQCQMLRDETMSSNTLGRQNNQRDRCNSLKASHYVISPQLHKLLRDFT